MSREERIQVVREWAIEFILAETPLERADIDMVQRLSDTFISDLSLTAVFKFGATVKIDYKRAWNLEQLIEMIADGIDS